MKLVKEAAPAAIAGLIVLVIGLVIARAGEEFLTFEAFGLAALFVIFTLIISLGVTVYFYRHLIASWERFETELRGEVDALDKRFNAVAAVFGVDWLVTNDQLMKIESDVGCENVWIITASLEEEISDAQFYNIIKGNLKRGIKYRYLIPDDPIPKGRANNLRAKLSDSSLVKFDFIDDPLFRIISMQDFAIYIPTSGNMIEARAYMNLPVEGGTENFIALGPKQTEALVTHLSQYFEKKTNVVNRGRGI